MDKPLTVEEFAKAMRAIHEVYRKDGDTERRHMRLDKLMADQLRALGYGDGVDVFEDPNTDIWWA